MAHQPDTIRYYVSDPPPRHYLPLPPIPTANNRGGGESSEHHQYNVNYGYTNSSFGGGNDYPTYKLDRNTVVDTSIKFERVQQASPTGYGQVNPNNRRRRDAGNTTNAKPRR